MTAHRVLVIGVGSIGERHVRCFQRTGRAELSICETNPELRNLIADRYEVRSSFESLGDALADPPEIAVICTPAPLHVPMATQLAEAGSHLLIEKPLSTSLMGVDALQTLVQKRSLACSIAYVYRAHPVLTAMREAIQSGRFGRPLQIVAVGGQHFPHYRPAYRTIYYNDRATGGGAIQDALTHVINAGEWIAGPITRVAADAAHLALEGVDVEDTVHVIARHGNVLASYSLNQHQPNNETTITVVCERGTVRFEGHQNRWRWTTRPEEAWHDEEFPPLERDDIFIRQADAFLDAVEGRGPVACTLEEGLRTLRVNLAILNAADMQQWRRVPPDV